MVERRISYGRSQTTFRKSEEHVAFRQKNQFGRDLFQTEDVFSEQLPPIGRQRMSNFSVVQVDPRLGDIDEAAGRAKAAADTPDEEPVDVYHTSDDAVPFVPEGTLHLAFQDDVTPSDIEKFAQNNGLIMIGAPRDGFYTADVRHQDRDAVEIAQELQQSELILLAEPDLTTPVSFSMDLPTDALMDDQWHLRNTGKRHGASTFTLKPGADARVVDAWERLGNLGNPDVILSMIDDGFDLQHPDLNQQIVSAHDFIRGSSNVSPEVDHTNPSLGDWHGTACAGLAVARAAGGKTVGVAPNAQFMPLRMARHLSPVEVESWFDYATRKGAWVISCSWNAEAKVYPLPERIYQALGRAATKGRDGKGTVLVFAAGNAGRDVNDPPNSLNGYATHPDVLAIAASTSTDEHAEYSDFGDEIAVCAPSGGRGGVAMTTSDVKGDFVDDAGDSVPMGFVAGAYNGGFSGTSAACPVVAGVCALVLGANPDLTAPEVREIMRQTARKIGDLSTYVDGHSPRFGYGCVDADAAVAKALSVATDAALYAALQSDAQARQLI
jgi:subtilisin family serine protease